MDLEKKFWQSMIDQDTDTATRLLCEPAVMVSSHGAMTFDHDGKMVSANPQRRQGEKALAFASPF